MLTLHHLEFSQSFRVLFLLEELGVDYDIKLYNRDPKTHLAPQEYKALSPTNAAPVITDGDLVLAETSAILDYILDGHDDGRLRPDPGALQRTQYLFWFHAAQGSMMTMMMMDSVFRLIVERSPFFLKPIIKPVMKKAASSLAKVRLDALFETAEKDLAETGWFAGDHMTAADILLSYPMESAFMRGYMPEKYANCRAWLERVYQQPSYLRAKEIDGRPSMVLPL